MADPMAPTPAVAPPDAKTQLENQIAQLDAQARAAAASGNAREALRLDRLAREAREKLAMWTAQTAAADEKEDLTIVPPEVIGGSY